MSRTLSSSWEVSNPSTYDIPEQPPLRTPTRKPSSGLFSLESNRFTSETAPGVKLIIEVLLSAALTQIREEWKDRAAWESASPAAPRPARPPVLRRSAVPSDRTRRGG